MSNQAFIPNSFQTPNAIIDDLMPLLTDSEFRVLMFMIREILGWQSHVDSKRANIAQSVMESGYTYEKNGETFQKMGCGIRKGAIKTALKALQTYRIIKAIGKASNDGQLWELCILTDSDPDIAGLKLRADTKKRNAKTRTENARKVNPKNQGGTVQQIPHRGDCPTDTQGDCPTDTNETHGNTEETHIKATPIEPSSNSQELEQPLEQKEPKPQEVLGQVMEKPPVTDSDWSLYGKVCKELKQAGIEPSGYSEYVMWVKRLAKTSGDWKVSIPSLISGGRVSDYVATKNKQSKPAAPTEKTIQEIGEEHIVNALKAIREKASA